MCKVEKIKEIIDRRGIKRLFHFTQLSNLESILERGLLTRAQLDKQELDYAFSDGPRIDKHTDATCCSVEFPNHYMFLKKRIRNTTIDWAVIEISADILHEKDCAFYPINAALSEVNRRDANDFKSAQDLEDLFQEFEGKASYSRKKLSNKYPTDPQAEVLVFDQIERKYLLAVHTNSKRIAETWNVKRLGINFFYRPKLFQERNNVSSKGRLSGDISFEDIGNNLVLRVNTDEPVYKRFVKDGVDEEGLVEFIIRLAWERKVQTDVNIPSYLTPRLNKKLVPVIKYKGAYAYISLEQVWHNSLNSLDEKPKRTPEEEKLHWDNLRAQREMRDKDKPRFSGRKKRKYNIIL